MHTGFWWENRKDRKKLEVVAVDGRIILKQLLSKWGWRAWVWPNGKTVGSCDYGKEPSGSIKRGEFLDSVTITFSGISHGKESKA